MDRTIWIKNTLLLGSFSIMGMSTYLFINSIYFSALSVSYEEPGHATSEEQRSSTLPSILPTRENTVRIIRNQDFGPDSSGESAQSNTSTQSSCPVGEYIKSLIHLHPNQGVHVRLQGGGTKYMFLETAYSLEKLLDESNNSTASSRFTEIAFVGHSDQTVSFELRGEGQCRGIISISE